ncbi:cytochrome c oxidase subunit 7A, mitochondrial [Anoplophora glabripennis]|nr:cytochrome c oxidase subunit 7A, mitochondrial [Anoplophora glabripennis]
MNNSKLFLNAARIYYRQMSKSAQITETVAPRYATLKNIQKKFQVDDGLPVYIKHGFGDKFLYNVTFALSIVGVGLSLETFYRLVFGKK